MGCKNLFILNFIVTAYLSGFFAGAIVYSPNPLPVGSNVTLSVTSHSSIPSGSWLFQGSIMGFWYPGKIVMSDAYINRTSVNVTTNQITLYFVSLNDSGTYGLQGISPDFSESIIVTVVEPISNVNLSVSGTDLVEFNNSVSFTCTVRGTTPSFTWYNGSSVVNASSNVLLSSDGSTLTISNVTRYDQGPFSCMGKNSISNSTSRLVTLNIYYGPSRLTLTVSPVSTVYMSGSNINLTCSCESYPQALFRWLFNGTLLSETSRMYQLKNTTQTQTGTYSCSAQNTMTLRYATAPIFISVLDPVISAAVSGANGQVIVNNSHVLTCVIAGPVSTVYWLKDGTLYSNSRSSLSNQNKTLTVNPLTLWDDGNYQCIAINAVSNVTSAIYVLTVNYGPWNVIISGPAYVATRSSATLNCTASSRPACSYSWYFNGTNVANGSVYQTGTMVSNFSGEYTCTASNNITGNSSSAKMNVTVIDPITSVIVVPTGQPKYGKTFAMGCDIRGFTSSVDWTKDGQSLSNQHLYLLYNPVYFNHNGVYRCKGTNPLGTMTSASYNLTVNYGPWNITVSGPSVVAAKSSVTLNCSASSLPASTYSWYFNSSKVAEGSVYQNPSIPLNQNGEYTCMANNSVTDNNSTAKWNVTVIDPVTSITVVSNSSAIYNRSFLLSCNTNGLPTFFFWMKDGRNISNSNKVLQLNTLNFTDNGTYQCGAGNIVSNMTSASFTLDVNYGPWTVAISGPSIVAAGSSLTLTCSASSQPASNYTWFFNGVMIAEGSVYQTSSIPLNQNGEHTCTAYNNITASSNSAKWNVTVIEPITAVTVMSGGDAKLNQPFNLTCQITGYASSVSWTKNGVNMSSSDRELKFNQIQLSHQARYGCTASNALMSKTSTDYSLIVNFGPLFISISGPTEAEEGASVTLRCFADSYPTCQFSWYFGGSKIEDGSLLNLEPFALSNQGEYQCIARNIITDISLNAKRNLVVSSVNFSSVAMIPSLNIPQVNREFQLVCNVTGRNTSIQWLKDDQVFSPTSTVSVINETILAFQSLQPTNDGAYRCIATDNQGEQNASQPYDLRVCYGPWDVTISIDASNGVTFICNARSYPPSVYRWILMGVEVGTGATIMPPMTIESLGKTYSCEATNPLTNETLIADYNIPDGATSLRISVLIVVCSLALPLLTQWE